MALRTVWLGFAAIAAAVVALLFVMHDSPSSSAGAAPSAQPPRVAPAQNVGMLPALPPSADHPVGDTRVPPPPPPPAGPPSPEMIARLDATRAQVRAAAQHCLPTNETPPPPRPDQPQTDRSIQSLRLRYRVITKAGTATLGGIEVVESDIADKRIEDCIAASMKVASWSSTEPDGELLMMDQIQLGELEAHPAPH